MALQEQDKHHYTVDEYYALSEGTRAEYIDGQIYYMSPAPNRIHQKTLNFVNTTIYNYIESNKGNCEVYPAPFDVELTINNEETKTINKHVFQPDISVICDKSKLTEQGCSGAPDWIIEIVSPSNSGHDYVLKLNKYMMAGVREYWIVNPKSKTLLVYFFESDVIVKEYTFNDCVKVNIYDDLWIDFGRLNV